jgi:putative endonuclease
LIFQDHQVIVFVEVKTRNFLEQGLPEEAVTLHKIHKISQVAQHYILQNHLEKYPARIDVIAIEMTKHPPVVRHLVDVTG